MNLLDGDNEEPVEFSKGGAYAARYDNWRRNEELQKLKSRHGDVSLEDDSSDETTAEEWESDQEVDWLRTMSALKSRDTRIYQTDNKWYRKSQTAPAAKATKSEKRAVTLKDHERESVMRRVEEGDNVSSDEEDVVKSEPADPTYVARQLELKKSFAQFLKDDDDDVGLLQEKKKSSEEVTAEEETHREWLRGRREELGNADLAGELAPLREYWTNPALNDSEKWLRDFLLEKRYKDSTVEHSDSEAEAGPGLDAVDLGEEETALEQQDQYERKYNFRYEEGNAETISYPRQMTESVRQTTGTRTEKRVRKKERHEKEKKKQKTEIKELKRLKRQELLNRLNMIRDVTGDEEIALTIEDLEEDFDPEKHSQMMEKIFSTDYYAVDEEERPVGGVEQEDLAEAEQRVGPEAGKSMDVGSAEFQELLKKPKPLYDPAIHKTFDNYLNEYYGLDYEDKIGDVKCRFRYRDVEPQDYGLTTEEIMLADDAELNRWVSVKRMVQYLPASVDRNENEKAKQKARKGLKSKIFTSIYGPKKPKNSLKDVEEEEDASESITNEQEAAEKRSEPNTKSGKKRKFNKDSSEVPHSNGVASTSKPLDDDATKKKRRKKKKTRNLNGIGILAERLKAYGLTS